MASEMKTLLSRNLGGVCQAFLISMLSIGFAGTAIGDLNPELKITEIMYNPLTFGDHVWEWIEVRNTNGSAIDLDGYIGRNLGDFALQSPSPTIDSALSTDTVIPAAGVGIIFAGNRPPGTAQDFDASLVRQAWGIGPNTPVIAAASWPALSNSTGQGQSIGFWANVTDYQADLVTGLDPNGLPDPNGPKMVGSFANAQFSINYSIGFPTVGGTGGPSIVWSGIGSNQNGARWVVSSDGDSSGAVTSVQVDIPGSLLDDIGNPGLLPSGDPNTGLLITEILYNPAGDEPDWEWIEIFNNTGSNIDFAATNYIVDDNNGIAAGTNITSGTLDNGEVGILFNVDRVDPNDFAAAWGTGLNLIPVTNWEALQLNNDDNGDVIAIWDDPNAYMEDHQTHGKAIVNQQYGVGDFPAEGQGQAIYLAELGLDPNDGNNWVLALEGDNLSFFAMGSGPNGTIVFHDGGDEGSPGTFTSFTIEDADFNGDGFVDGRDFLTWQRGLGVGSSQAEGDANGDGVVNATDLAIWESQYGTTLSNFNADFDNDNDVDGDDFLIWQRGLGVGSNQAEGDANGDGVVNADDLAIWEAQYGTQPLSVVRSAVPEPRTLVLMLAGLAGMVTRRRL